MIEQLKSDKLVTGRVAGFEKQLDGLIEEQIYLKEEETKLIKKVKVAKAKADSGQENRSNKIIEPVFSQSLAKPRNASKGKPQEERGDNGLTAS